MTDRDPVAEVRRILDGIDRDEIEPGGWWETSTGVTFGAAKLAEVIGELSAAHAGTLTEAAEAVEAEADRCVGQQHDQYLSGLYGAADLLRALAATEPADNGKVER